MDVDSGSEKWSQRESAWHLYSLEWPAGADSTGSSLNSASMMQSTGLLQQTQKSQEAAPPHPPPPPHYRLVYLATANNKREWVVEQIVFGETHEVVS